MLLVRWRVDRSMMAYALEAIAEEGLTAQQFVDRRLDPLADADIDRLAGAAASCGIKSASILYWT